MACERPQSARAYQPLVAVAAAVVAGILVAEVVGGGMVLWATLAVVVAVAWVVLRWTTGRHRWTLAALLALAAAAAGARYRSTVDPPDDDVARLIADGPRMAALEGVVVRSPRTRPPPADVFVPRTDDFVRTTLTLASERARLEGEWHPARGRVVVSIPGPGFDASGEPLVRLGDRVEVLGVACPFRPPANPGAFDRGAYYRRQGVRAALYTRRWEAVEVIAPRADVGRSVLGAMRRWAVRRLDRIESPEGRAVVSAVVFGRRDLLREQETLEGGGVEEAFLASGTAHFLAVSGLHVGLVAGAVLLVARLLGLGRMVTAVAVMAVVLAYALTTELKPSVVRAAILVGVLCLGWGLGRPALRLNSLAAAVILVLLLRPGDLFTLGFQLSFGVVLGLVWLTPVVERDVLRADPEAERLAEPGQSLGYRVYGWFRRTAAISLAASLVSIPLIASRTHLVAWLAPVGSVLLAPLVFGVLASGLVLVAVGWAAPWLGDILAAVPDGFARAVSGVVRGLAAVPGGHFYLPRFEWPWLLVTYGLLVAWAFRERLGVTPRRLALVALAVAAIFLWTGGRRVPDSPKATFCAVGHGVAGLVELPNGRTLLYDAGSSLTWARAAEGATAPAVWSRGVGRVDAVFLSHAHFDHFKDILPIARRFGVRQVFVPPTFVRERLTVDESVVESLVARGARVTFFSGGDRLAGTGGTDVRAVWPRGRASQTDEINDGSLVLSICDAGGPRLLLTGDLEPGGIRAMLATEPDLACEVMLWPHHGGSPQAAEKLAAATGAGVLVVSSGRRLPHEKSGPAWLRERGITCYRTGECGAVTVRLERDEVVASGFLETGNTP